MADPVGADGGELIVDLAGFEGPISLLLHLARDQKVDLKHISILALADQYLAFIAEVRLRLELAGDYLVMAAWLAYLKSRLLLPEPPLPDDDEPSGAVLAEALHRRLMRLQAMQDAAKSLFMRPLLGRDVFLRGMVETPPATVNAHPAGPTIVYAVTLHDLLQAYGRIEAAGNPPVLTIRAPHYYSVDDALERLRRLVGSSMDWQMLMRFLPPQLNTRDLARSALAATFTASLELAKAGHFEIRQEKPFGPIYVRACDGGPHGL